MIVVPAVLLTMTMVFQGMEYYWGRQAAETAARQAIEAARVVGSNDGDGTVRAQAVLTQLGSPLENVTVSVTNQNGSVIATITGHPHQLLPGWAMSVRVSAEGPTEQFLPPP